MSQLRADSDGQHLLSRGFGITHEGEVDRMAHLRQGCYQLTQLEGPVSSSGVGVSLGQR